MNMCVNLYNYELFYRCSFFTFKMIFQNIIAHTVKKIIDRDLIFYFINKDIDFIM